MLPLKPSLETIRENKNEKVFKMVDSVGTERERGGWSQSRFRR